ncbi:MAG: DUF512 domain-containing protein [Lachnospiraceae bacterium]|nr:DUF512 domain-containing protein [Lachnospiraceae bacterium]
MKKTREHVIRAVEPGSIAEELNIEAGDVLLTVNDTNPLDVLDYHFLIHDEELVVCVRKPDGEEWEFEIEKEFDEDLGIQFENTFMDEYHSCRNKCIFCFIDQMPPGMRESLYFKDDDSRLSFLQGNYVTLTNMKEEEIRRIIRCHLSPINVSVHTTEPELRKKMLHNRFAGESLRYLDMLCDAGIEMNGQIVLCKDVNDGAHFTRTVQDLRKYIPFLQSISVVPAGVTKYRKGLYPLKAFTKEDACALIDETERFQREIFAEHGTHFIHASDEWYLMAERDFPEEERYDGYLQLENGVGMMRLLMNEFAEELVRVKEQVAKSEYGQSVSEDSHLKDERNALEDSHLKDEQNATENPYMKDERNASENWLPEDGLNKCLPSEKSESRNRTVSLATGTLAAPVIRQLAEDFMLAFPSVKILVYPIRNDFFGETITVSGLLTGQDIIRQLTGRELGVELLLPGNVLRSGEDVFLDDITLSQMEEQLQIPVTVTGSSGADLLHAFLGDGEAGDIDNANAADADSNMEDGDAGVADVNSKIAAQESNAENGVSQIRKRDYGNTEPGFVYSRIYGDRKEK